MQKGPTDQLFGLYFLITYGCSQPTSQLKTAATLGPAGDQRDLWMAAISIASAYKPKDPVAGGVGPVAPDVPPEKVGFMALLTVGFPPKKMWISKSSFGTGMIQAACRTMSVRSVSEQKTSRGTVGRTSESSESRVSGQQRWVEIGGWKLVTFPLFLVASKWGYYYYIVIPYKYQSKLSIGISHGSSHISLLLITYLGELLVGMRVSVPFLMAEATPLHPLRFSSWFCSVPCDTVNRTGETLQQMPFAKGSNALKKTGGGRKVASHESIQKIQAFFPCISTSSDLLMVFDGLVSGTFLGLCHSHPQEKSGSISSPKIGMEFGTKRQ